MVLNPDDAADWPAPLNVRVPCQGCASPVDLRLVPPAVRLGFQANGGRVLCPECQRIATAAEN